MNSSWDSNTGAVVSSIVNVAEVVAVLPHASMAVKVTIAAPVAAQSVLRDSKSFVQSTPLHKSVAAAPPLASSHSARSDALPVPSHSTVRFIASSSITGETVSSIVNAATEVIEFPQSSVAVKITVAPPVAPQSSLKALKSLLHVTFPQASEAEAPPFEASHELSSAALPAPSHSTEMLIASSSIIGAVVS